MWFDTVCYPIYDESGKVTRLAIIARDITDYKRAEEALRESEVKLRSIFNSSPNAITVTDLNGTILECNQMTLEIHGCSSKDEILGKNAAEFIAEEDHGRAAENMRKTLEQGFVKNVEYTLVTKDGQPFPGELSASPMTDSSGNPTGFVAVTRDITERKRAEEALRKSEAKFRYIFDSGMIGIIYWNLEGNITDANEAFLNMVGYTKEELLTGKASWKNMTPPEYSDLEAKAIEEIVQRGVITPYEKEYIRKDGSRIPIILGAAKLEEYEGTGVGFVLDITERKRAEEELEKYRHHLETLVEERTAELSRVNAELVRANRLKDEFLANMSHELRTPLNVILGMSESLQEEVYGSLNDRQRHSLHMIGESGHHLLTLIIDILDLAKIGAGKLELEINPVLVESTCQAALRLTKQLAHKKRLKVSSMFDSHVTTIHVDGRRLKQILVNLLNNAVKFTPEGGKVGLEVEGDSEQQTVHFTVWDTGIGIAPEDMERLFQPFVQLDASLSRKYEGTGLGLALVSRIVDLHGGSVSVESEVGQGSRFTVSLPWQGSGDGEIGSLGDGESQDIDPHSPISPPPHLPISSPPQSRTILIAEDNEAMIATLSGYFVAKGERVLIARNGWEAVAQTREFHPDIIVMDIQMSEMDGLEAIRHIRSEQHGQSIPIIALTALAMPGDREQCLAAGADEYLSKPVSLRRLSETIERFLSRKE